MLARVTGGKSGIVEYLVNGIKTGRELDRDTLDNRICLDGNINITDKIINSMSSEENYLHITLSFNDRGIDIDKIQLAYQEYKKHILNAYEDDEFNIYAEIHQPKIKSYKDKKTGETIERYPHVHIVLPKMNLVTGKTFNPFGKYSDSIKYHDAIQESVNRKFRLSSPYDNQRPIEFQGNSKFISRYKGDTFNNKNVKFKSELLDVILKNNIRNRVALIQELKKYGSVSLGSSKLKGDYLKVMPFGTTTNIRLTEGCFNEKFLVERTLVREKPSNKQIINLVNDWSDRVSFEKKYIHPSSPKVRKEYFARNKHQRKEILDGRRKQFRERYFSERGRSANIKSSFMRAKQRGFTKITNGLPNMPQRGLDGSTLERPKSTAGFLPGHEDNYLESNQQREYRGSQLRRSFIGRRGGVISSKGYVVDANIRGFIAKPVSPQTLPERLLHEHFGQSKQQEELAYFRVLRAELKASSLIHHLKKSHGLNDQGFKIINAKDGSQRIKVDSIGYNVSDFCTKYMKLTWDETKVILQNVYKSQSDALVEKKIINSISFASKYVTGSFSESKSNRLNESIRILRYLQKIESKGDSLMLNDLKKFKTIFKPENSISAIDELTAVKNLEQIKRNKAADEAANFKISDIVARKDLQNGKVEFRDFNTSKLAFTDTGNKIVFNDKVPDAGHVAAAMAIAAEKFGVLKITGTKEFKKSIIDIAVAKDLRLVFDDKSMQSDFVKARDLKAQNLAPESINNTNNIQNVDQFIVKFSAIESTGLIKLEVNGKHPSTIEPEIMSKIRETDNFLNGYDMKDISSGVLDPKHAPNTIPEDGKFDASGVNIGFKEKESIKATDVHSNESTKEVTDALQPATLLKHGAANFQFKEDESKSYFVTLDNGKTTWGKGLESAINDSGAKVGDVVLLSKTGATPVEVDAKIRNEEGKVVGKEKIHSNLNSWDIQVKESRHLSDAKLGEPKDQKPLSPNESNKTYVVTYKFNAKTEKLNLEINGKHPTTIKPSIIDKIKDNDPFLKNYSSKEIQGGKLEPSKAGQIQPIPRTFNDGGEVVVDKVLTQGAPQLKR